MIHLENECLKAAISPSGAELRAVESKETGLHYMWSGDSTYWGRVSPVLFPIIGRLKKDQYELNGKTYKLPQHGFLRDVEFSVLEQEIDKASFLFDSSDTFLDVYPYRFQAIIHYQLKGSSLSIGWEIRNEQGETMHFSIGGHPAFNVPLTSGEKAEDYTLQFTPAEGEQVTQYELAQSLVKEKQTLQTVDPLQVEASLFENDALIYSNIDRVSLTSNQTGHGVDVELTGFPFVGIWSSYNGTMAPFVCIEPWYGIADTVDTTGKLVEKKGIQQLEKGAVFQADYTITFK